MGIFLGETKEKAMEIFLTVVEIGAAIAAMVLAAVSLAQAVVDNPCWYQGYPNTTELDPKDKCFVMSTTELICCGQDRAAVTINAGVLQLSAVVLVVLAVRLLLTAWRCTEVRKEVKENGNSGL